MTRAADVKNLALRPDQIQTLRDAANAYSAILEFRRASSLLFVDTWGKGGLGALWKLFKEEMPRLDGMWLSIYFVKCGEHVKVGIATHVGKRISSLQTATAQPIELLAAVKGTPHDERALHKRLSEHRVKGEWFKDCDAVRSAMAQFVEHSDVADKTAFVKPETITLAKLGRRSSPARLQKN